MQYIPPNSWPEIFLLHKFKPEKNDDQKDHEYLKPSTDSQNNFQPLVDKCILRHVSTKIHTNTCSTTLNRMLKDENFKKITTRQIKKVNLVQRKSYSYKDAEKAYIIAFLPMIK